MSTIGGIGGLGGYSALSLLGNKGKSEFREEELLSLSTANVPAPTAFRGNNDNGESYRAEQAINEGFARIRLRLEEASKGKEVGVTQGVLSKPLGEGSNVALDEFKKYMEMTPAEKMRDSVLKELGLTEDELKSLPPEQQAAIEEKIVQRIKERSAVAINEGNEGQKSNPWGAQQVGGQVATGRGGDVDDRMSFSQFA
ncbi:hypothetical protein [Pseudomonas sp. GD03944]|uniref:hypothetical protein n=1 Tax=Pseudomonas sp. GD03944 TaxID=2975409 RepID=UPI002449DC30|nr:hypothetical protein [Pseudomonas sp. GD03944]MDH1262038.1 hypothetical protein [Pseudomonas sp. GD03944]